MDNSVAPSTRSAYASAQHRYAAFCVSYAVQPPYPLQEVTLCRYVTYLAQQGLKHRTIKAYLSGIRCLQIQKALGNPLVNGSMSRLEYVLMGIKRAQAHSGIQACTRLPITIDIMYKLNDVWITSPQQPELVTVWAAVCTGLLGFLRAGEFTVPSLESHDAGVHLSLSDIALDSHSDPSMVQLRIKQSKTDPFWQGVEIFLGRPGTGPHSLYRDAPSEPRTTVHLQLRSSTYQDMPGLKSASCTQTGGIGRLQI